MDNFRIDLVTEGGPTVLQTALSLVVHRHGKATHYVDQRYREETTYYGKHHVTKMVPDPTGVPTLILLWHEEGRQEVVRLPYPLDLGGLVPFVDGWLAQVDYGREPDHDGDNGKGWRVFTEDWGHVAGYSYAIVGVQPAWAMYGK